MTTSRSFPGLVAELRHLVVLAGTDEHTAATGLDVLIANYGRPAVGRAVLAVTAEFSDDPTAPGPLQG